jgi:hypothetical protein
MSIYKGGNKFILGDHCYPTKFEGITWLGSAREESQEMRRVEVVEVER